MQSAIQTTFGLPHTRCRRSCHSARIAGRHRVDQEGCEPPPRSSRSMAFPVECSYPPSLPPLEVGLALLNPGGHALYCVCAGACLHNERIYVVVRDVVAKLHLTHYGRLHGAEREGRIGDEPSNDTRGLGLQLFGQRDLSENAEFVHPSSRDWVAKQ